MPAEALLAYTWGPGGTVKTHGNISYWQDTALSKTVIHFSSPKRKKKAQERREHRHLDKSGGRKMYRYMFKQIVFVQ